MELCVFVHSCWTVMKILYVKGVLMMGSLRHRLEKIEKTVNPRKTAVAEWAIRCVSAEQEFQRILNKMRAKYCCSEPTPLVTSENVLEEARKLEQKYGTVEAFNKAKTNSNNPEIQQYIAEIKVKYGLR